MIFSKSRGAFLLSELASQTHQFAKKAQQFEVCVIIPCILLEEYKSSLTCVYLKVL